MRSRASLDFEALEALLSRETVESTKHGVPKRGGKRISQPLEFGLIEQALFDHHADERQIFFATGGKFADGKINGGQTEA